MLLVDIDAKGQAKHYPYDAALLLAEWINGNGERYTTVKERISHRKSALTMRNLEEACE